MPTNPILTQRALLLAKVESSYNSDALPVPTLDALLCSDADFQIDPTVLERNFYRPSLSPLQHAMGRKLARISFKHEIRGNGGITSASKLGMLLRGCGFQQTQITNILAAVIRNPVASPTNAGATIAWAKTTLPTQNYTRYGIRVVKGGASATAQVRVTGNPHEAADTGILPSEEFSATSMNEGRVASTVITVDDVTNPIAVTYSVATPAVGEIVILVVGGVRVKHTVTSAVANTEATAIAATLTAAAAGRWTVASATNVVTVTITAGVSAAITSGTAAVTLGASGAQLTPTWTGSLGLNDTWTVDLWQPGFHYTPVSTGHESLTIMFYRDGQVHRLTGCIGTVSFSMESGQLAMASFQFTGQYIQPTDTTLPTNAVFERQRPVQVELAQLKLGGSRLLRAQSVTVDMGITVNPRESVSHPDGYDGVLYSTRNPTGGCNPEVDYESVEPYWRNLAAATPSQFHCRVGTVTGNRVHFFSNTVQMSSLGYTDRNNNLAYDIGLAFKADSDNGDDEVRIAFT